MGEFGKCRRDPLGGRSLDAELAIQQSAADLVDQGESVVANRLCPFGLLGQVIDQTFKFGPPGRCVSVLASQQN